MSDFTNDKKHLAHYGTPKHSGRYPWGSGDNPYQSGSEFSQRIADLKRKGLSEREIARALGALDSKGEPNTTILRARNTMAKAAKRSEDVARAIDLKDHGYSNMEIGRRMGINESSVRNLLNPTLQARSDVLVNTANELKSALKEKPYLDIGLGVENYIGESGIARTKLKTAVQMLKEEGYEVHYLKVPQVGNPGKYTTTTVLTEPDVPYKQVYKDRGKVQLINEVPAQDSNGKTKLGIDPPVPVAPDRVTVKYGPDGGTQKDGVIELRRGVPDLDLGNSQYAQVRIQVGKDNYLKGMAMYADDLPEGSDIRFNTNKASTGNKLDAMKTLKDDPDNPFGSTIKVGGQKGALNIVREEGDWDTWSKTISSQVLSKQSNTLAKKQLGLAYDVKKDEYDEIMSLTNPVIKKRLLESFADDCDASAVHLKAAALPRQRNQVILPLTKIKEGEVYAPNFKDGESVVLIRHPHGGTFEIPELTVNNRSREAKAVMKNAVDAIGINPKVAERLSGADFDGDTVIVIPNPGGKYIRTSSPLKALEGFNPREKYSAYEGMQTIDGGIIQNGKKTHRKDANGKDIPYKSQTMQVEMGKVSNLITDMTIKGAKPDELARAVKHSMVVIDSEKHGLNYKLSAEENGIAALKKQFQGGSNKGASTLVSRASSEARPDHRKETFYINAPGTKKYDPSQPVGSKIYKYTNEAYINKQGKNVTKTTKSTKMAETNDAYTLSSGSKIEDIYADHANNMKALANQARLSYLNTPSLEYSASANKTYSREVASLNAHLRNAQRNAPLERRAQILANSVVAAKKEANPDMDKDDLKKIKNQALAQARATTGAGKNLIKPTDREWQAIQHGAISHSKLTQIIANSDIELLKERATPRTAKGMSSAKIARVKSYLNNGYTQAEVADMLGVSVSTINNAINS